MRAWGMFSGDLIQPGHREGFLKEVALRLREVKKFVQVHTTGNWKGWDFFFFFFFFFFSFLGHTRGLWEVPGDGVNVRNSFWPTPQPQQLGI